MVQGRIDQQCLIESGRALGGKKKKRLLADPSLDAAQAVQQTQPLSRALREATKRLRQLPGAEGPGVAVDEEEEDKNLVSMALEKWMKRMVQSGLKREPKTPRPPQPTPPPPPTATARPALKRPATTSSSTVPDCVVHWPETIIEHQEEEETGWLWVGYPKMDQQEWARVALARLSVHGTRHAFEETLATRGSGH